MIPTQSSGFQTFKNKDHDHRNIYIMTQYTCMCKYVFTFTIYDVDIYSILFCFYLPTHIDLKSTGLCQPTSEVLCYQTLGWAAQLLSM